MEAKHPLTVQYYKHQKAEKKKEQKLKNELWEQALIAGQKKRAPRKKKVAVPRAPSPIRVQKPEDMESRFSDTNAESEDE